jgi:hypothetical protein
LALFGLFPTYTASIVLGYALTSILVRHSLEMPKVTKRFAANC